MGDTYAVVNKAKQAPPTSISSDRPSSYRCKDRPFKKKKLVLQFFGEQRKTV